MRTPERITVIPTLYHDVLSLLKSDTLASIEHAIATKCGLRIIFHDSTASTSHTQAEISVSGMTVGAIEEYLQKNRIPITAFGIHFLHDPDATSDEQEYPEGEEQDPNGESVTLGIGNGFAISYAIYHNFLANRPLAEFHAFLKNRRIPKHTKFAKALLRVYESTNDA